MREKKSLKPKRNLELDLYRPQMSCGEQTAHESRSRHSQICSAIILSLNVETRLARVYVELRGSETNNNKMSISSCNFSVIYRETTSDRIILMCIIHLQDIFNLALFMHSCLMFAPLHIIVVVDSLCILVCVSRFTSFFFVREKKELTWHLLLYFAFSVFFLAAHSHVADYYSRG